MGQAQLNHVDPASALPELEKKLQDFGMDGSFNQTQKESALRRMHGDVEAAINALFEPSDFESGVAMPTNGQAGFDSFFATPSNGQAAPQGSMGTVEDKAARFLEENLMDVFEDTDDYSAVYDAVDSVVGPFGMDCTNIQLNLVRTQVFNLLRESVEGQFVLLVQQMGEDIDPEDMEMLLKAAIEQVLAMTPDIQAWVNRGN
jgi:hypothetical protein